mgnify:CR=1 FL=1
MKRIDHGKKGGEEATILGVSEAVGTVLLLGLSVMLAGGIALWTSQIEDMEEGLYVDLYVSLREETLTVTHRGGDQLPGEDTEITVRNSDGSVFDSLLYYDPAEGRTDDTWGNGDQIEIPLSGSSDDLTVVITTVKKDGTRTVVLNNEMTKSVTPAGTPDIAVTRLSVMQSGGDREGYILDYGTSLIIVEVTNLGGPMSVPWVYPDVVPSVSNLQVHDNVDELKITKLGFTHEDNNGDEIEPGDSGYTVLGTGHKVRIVLTWDEDKSTPRTLGDHEMKARVIPFGGGEADYRNNIVTRKYTVDKDTTPDPIPGPDPGIYDVYFSDEMPNSGDEVTVTVVVENSGSEPITDDMDVQLVVSLWAPAQRNIAHTGYDDGITVYDWMMDDPTYYEQWRLGNEVNPLQEDLEFPTCIITDLEVLPGSYQFFYFSLEANVDIPGGQQKVYAIVNAYDGYDDDVGILPLEGDNHKDNTGLGVMQVFPRILIVDDDGETTGSDMTSNVVESLTGAGILADSTVVPQEIQDMNGFRDAPAYSYDWGSVTMPAMEDFDIVIWITGYRTDALSNSPVVATTDYGGNIQEIMTFMENNGYFLLVGAHPIDGLLEYFNNREDPTKPDPAYTGSPAFRDASDFAYKYLGISRIDSGVDLPIGETLPSGKLNTLIGIDGGEGGITEVDEGTYNIELKDLETGNALSTLFLPRDLVENKDSNPYFDIPKGVLTSQEELDKGTDYANIIRAWSFPDTDTGAQYKSVVMGWDASQIKYLNQKIDLFARAMKWLDWEIQIGRDLAVTKMELYLLSQEEGGSWNRDPVDNEEVVPKYLDTIEIEVTVRNNGYREESTTVIFYVTGPNGVEVPVTPKIPEPRPEGYWPPGKTDDDDNPVDISYVEGAGGEVTKYKLWLALGSGLYNFRVMVDPYHLIDEINEENNDITYSTTTLTSLIAENNILVVDDDGSSDNFPSDIRDQAKNDGISIQYDDGEPSQAVIDSLEEMGFEYETITTQNSHDTNGWVIGSGPLVEELKRFNSVIWVTGDSGSVPALDRETLTDQDIISLTKYLDGIYDEAEFLGDEHNENLMFTGRYLLEDISGTGDIPISSGGITTSTHTFLREYPGVEPETTSPAQETGESLWGERSGTLDSEVYFGMEMGSQAFASDGQFQYQPLLTHSGSYSTVRSAFRTLNTAKQIRTVSTQHWHHDIAEGNYFRTIFHSWNLDELVNTGAETAEHPFQEVVFQSLYWFETPVEAPELISRNILFDIGSEHPSIGNSYIVTLELSNIGGESGGGTVRFLDGDTLFTSRYVFLDPGDHVTIETMWEPQYAGKRVIRAWIDRFDDSDEVFDLRNNIPTKRIEVYYFWDDMEAEDNGNFEHDSLVANINGENPLDYYDPMDEDPQTNVISSWDTDMSHGLSTVGDSYKSAPYSFQLEESTGVVKGVANVLISFVIDDSASMSGRTSSAGKTWLEEAKDAALVLLNELSNESVCVSIWDFQGNLERRYSGPTDRGTSEKSIPTKIVRDPVRVGEDFGGISGRQLIRNEIDDMENSAGTTILWDAIGEAYKDIDYWSTYYPELTPVVVVLSDGMDLQSSDGSALSLNTVDQKVEAGSTYWAPWGSMWDGEQYYPQHMGKYTIDLNNMDTDTYWMYALTTGAVDRSRYGLLYSDIPIYTVGLGLEHHEPPYEPVETVNPLGNPINQNHIKDFIHAYCSDTANYALESGTLEYNLWRIANTSDAQYFYAPSADELEDIFRKLGELLAEPQEQTRGAETRIEETPNENKWATTHEFDISEGETTTLSFWHKYNIVDGANGGYVTVGYRDPNVDTNADGDPGNDWDWRYITPEEGFYSGSLYPGYERRDSFGNSINWGYNGRSGEGTFSWEYVQFEIHDYVPETLRNRVKIQFYYIQYGGGTGDGWWFDDVRIVMSRSDTASVVSTSHDTWRLIEGSVEEGTTHSGTHAWFAGGSTLNDDFHEGIDNSLYTRPVDLTNARYAYLEFYTRFNFQSEMGRPPDGFRVEISSDNGVSWSSLNFGVRASWKVSGTESDPSDGVVDGKSFTGITEPEDSYNWVPASSITRITLNLKGYTGDVIILRFRLVTNIDGIHYENAETFKGIYIDDVMVYGESQETTRSGSVLSEDDPIHNGILGGSKTDEDPISDSEIEEDITVDNSKGLINMSFIILGLLLLVSLLYFGSSRIRKGGDRP